MLCLQHQVYTCEGGRREGGEGRGGEERRGEGRGGEGRGREGRGGEGGKKDKFFTQANTKLELITTITN